MDMLGTVKGGMTREQKVQLRAEAKVRCCWGGMQGGEGGGQGFLMEAQCKLLSEQTVKQPAEAEAEVRGGGMCPKVKGHAGSKGQAGQVTAAGYMVMQEQKV
jgi:hypothetical protein